MTTGHAALFFRSLAIPVRQRSTDGDNWSLQLAVNIEPRLLTAEGTQRLLFSTLATVFL